MANKGAVGWAGRACPHAPGPQGGETPCRASVDALAVDVAGSRDHQAIGRVHGHAEAEAALVDRR